MVIFGPPLSVNISYNLKVPFRLWYRSLLYRLSLHSPLRIPINIYVPYRTITCSMATIGTHSWFHGHTMPAYALLKVHYEIETSRAPSISHFLVLLYPPLPLIEWWEVVGTVVHSNIHNLHFSHLLITLLSLVSLIDGFFMRFLPS